MKVLIRPSVKLLDIEIVLDYELSDVAADRLIEHPKNIKKRRRISEVKLQILNDVAESAKAIILASQFPVSTEYVSKKDYSYYIEFRAINNEGKELLPVGIRFRISDHIMKGEETPLDSNTVIIRSFVLKGKVYENSIEIIRTISNICQELKRGNISVLNKYTY